MRDIGPILMNKSIKPENPPRYYCINPNCSNYNDSFSKIKISPVHSSH